MGPPDSRFIFPEPLGISEAEKRELPQAEVTPDESLACKAAAEHLCELYGVRGNGDIRHKIEIEVDSGRNLGKILDVRYEWNFETTAEGPLKKKSSQMALAGKAEKTIGSTPYKGAVTEWMNEEGLLETKAQFSAGAYGFEYNFSAGEVKAGAGPFFVRANPSR